MSDSVRFLIPRRCRTESCDMVRSTKKVLQRYKTLQWCDVANVLRIQLERLQVKYFPSLREYSLYFGINKKMLDELDHDIVLMHPGPINRGVELTSDAADSRQSIILNQVENGVAVRMAVLYLLAQQ